MSNSIYNYDNRTDHKIDWTQPIYECWRGQESVEVSLKLLTPHTEEVKCQIETSLDRSVPPTQRASEKDYVRATSKPKINDDERRPYSVTFAPGETEKSVLLLLRNDPISRSEDQIFRAVFTHTKNVTPVNKSRSCQIKIKHGVAPVPVPTPAPAPSPTPSPSPSPTFDTTISFATTATPPTVNGVSARTASTTSAFDYRFNAIASPTGTGCRMNVFRNNTQIISVDFSSDYVGRSFAVNEGATLLISNFVNGRVDI